MAFASEADDAALHTLFLQQQQLIDSLLATRVHLLKQHEDCAFLASQMASLSLSVAAVPAAPFGKKKRRDEDEDVGADEYSGADWQTSQIGEEQIVYRSMSLDDVEAEGSEAVDGGSKLALQARAPLCQQGRVCFHPQPACPPPLSCRQVKLQEQIVAELKAEELWKEAGSAKTAYSRLNELSLELAATSG